MRVGALCEPGSKSPWDTFASLPYALHCILAVVAHIEVAGPERRCQLPQTALLPGGCGLRPSPRSTRGPLRVLPCSSVLELPLHARQELDSEAANSTAGDCERQLHRVCLLLLARASAALDRAGRSHAGVDFSDGLLRRRRQGPPHEQPGQTRAHYFVISLQGCPPSAPPSRHYVYLDNGPNGVML